MSSWAPWRSTAPTRPRPSPTAHPPTRRRPPISVTVTSAAGDMTMDTVEYPVRARHCRAPTKNQQWLDTTPTDGQRRRVDGRRRGDGHACVDGRKFGRLDRVRRQHQGGGDRVTRSAPSPRARPPATCQQVIPHGLGQAPKAVILWTEARTDATFSGATGITFRAAASGGRRNWRHDPDHHQAGRHRAERHDGGVDRRAAGNRHDHAAGGLDARPPHQPGDGDRAIRSRRTTRRPAQPSRPTTHGRSARPPARPAASCRSPALTRRTPSTGGGPGHGQRADARRADA